MRRLVCVAVMVLLVSYSRPAAAQKGPHFRIYAISPDNLDTRLDTAAQEGRRLGLIRTFDQTEIGVVDERSIKYTQSVQEQFLIEQVGRHDDRIDAELTRMDLCRPAAVAVFGFQDRTLRGLTSNAIGTTECAAHNLSADHASGVSFIDDIPDELRRYVLIHELGHYFGLCHVDGFQNIMVSGAEGQGDAFIGSSIPSSFVHGGPRFTLAQAKQVWRFILANFPTACLLGGTEPAGGLTFVP